MMCVNDMMMNRRTMSKVLTGAAALMLAGEAKAKPDVAMTPLQRFMKVYASLTPGTLWYWYEGTIELALQDAPVAPFVGINTLIRRDVSLNADGTFAIVSSEANYFHALQDTRPLDSMLNPMTGRRIEPLHFSEGPRPNLWSDASLAPRKTAEIETAITWREAGPYTWLYRTLHADSPHPLDMHQWPLEASGARNHTGSFSTHCALSRDVANPALMTAPCSFSYEAIFGWFPWLLMGQRPGQMLWRASGMKLPSLDDLPGASRAGFEQTFPAIFTGAGFGAEGVNVWSRFRATRKPVTP